MVWQDMRSLADIFGSCVADRTVWFVDQLNKRCRIPYSLAHRYGCAYGVVARSYLDPPDSSVRGGGVGHQSI